MWGLGLSLSLRVAVTTSRGLSRDSHPCQLVSLGQSRSKVPPVSLGS